MKNLPKYVAEDRLRELFSQKGEITDAKLMRTKYYSSFYIFLYLFFYISDSLFVIFSSYVLALNFNYFILCMCVFLLHLWDSLGMVRAGSSLLLGSTQSVKLKKLSNTSTNLTLILLGLLVRCTLLFLVLSIFK